MKNSCTSKLAGAFLFVLSLGASTAAAQSAPPIGCLYALDPTASSAFSIAGSTIYTACSLIVESTSSSAFEMEGSETLYLQDHAEVGVVGGWQLNNQKLWDTISNEQVQPTQVTSPGDPLANIVAPTSGTIVSTSHANFDMNNKPPNDTLSPGVYCGGLTIGNTNGAWFTMTGTYIMAGGGITINSQAMVTGTGVTVYNTSSTGWGCSGSSSYTPVTISGQATVTLSAPTTGALNGILFFGSRTGCSTLGSCQDQINGDSTTTFNGALYFKTDQLTFSGSNTSGFMMLVADKIYINGSASFGNNGNPFDDITVSVTPSSAALYASQTQQFTATVANSGNQAVTWSISPASGAGTISTSGLYTAPSTITAQQTVTITATSQADNTKSGAATVTLFPPATVGISPTTATLYGNNTQQFTASVGNAINTAVTWSLNPSGVGSVSATGLYTAPATVSSQQSVTVTATSVVNTAKYASAVVTLLPSISVTVAPTTVTLYGGQSQMFTASLVNTSNQTVTWTISPSSGAGTINGATGAYTAPASIASSQTVTVRATSQANTSATATAMITLSPPISVTVAPSSVTLSGGQSQTFTATVVDNSNQTVAWTISPASGAGTINSTTGVYTGPASVTAVQTVTITATSQANTAATGTATITLEPSALIFVTPTTATLYTGGQTEQFTATVTFNSNTAVTWSANPSTVGTISSTGLYTAPASIGSTQVVTVTATSVADTTKSASAVVGVTPAGTVWISPSTSTLAGSQTQQFSAGAAFSNTAVTWSISPAGVGSLDNTGFYTAPACIYGNQTVTVTATSVANPSVSASAAVTLENANGYGYGRAITISHTQVPNTDQTNFPFLFNTTDPAFATLANGGHIINPNGYDIIFSTDPNGFNTLNYELEQYNPVTGQVIAWVRIPTLSHTVDTVIYIFYGNSNVTTSQATAAAVWDSNYQAVWHLPNGTVLSANDSTANGNNGTISNVAPGTGQIDGAANFSGSSMQSIGTSYAGPPSLTPFTVSFWTATTSTSQPPGKNTAVIMGWGNAGSCGGSGYFVIASVDGLGNGDDHTGLQVDWPCTGYQQWPNGIVYDGNWQYVVLTCTGSTCSAYRNGVAQSGTGTQSAVGTGNNVKIGNGDFSDSGPFTGQLDEMRISSIARSPDWITTEYNNQSSPSTFYALAAEVPSTLIVTPPAVSLFATQTQQFTSGQPSACGSAITWSLTPAGVGTINAVGLYTAPATVAAQQVVTVTATTTGSPTATATATITLLPPITVGPTTSTLSAGQTQLFTAVANGGVTWSINPSSAGSISTTGLYTAPSCIPTQQTVTVTATTSAGQSAAATITLLAGNGFSYSRIVVIDHTKVPNTDQANFPFLFNTTDPALATLANGGHVTSPNGYDIIFSTDPNGLSTLSYELEQYNPATGQVIAWVRIPTLSHTADTVLYVFYGNPNITTSQATPSAVWDSNFKGVWHFSTPTALSVTDSTGNANNGTINGSPSVIAGQIGWAADFAGTNDYLAIQSIPLASVDYTISAWFSVPFPNTGSWNTLTRGVNSDHQVIVNESNWHLGSYGSQNGGFWDSGFDVSTLSAGWHHVVADAHQGATTFYIDGAPVGSIAFQSVSQVSYLGNYQGGGQQFGGTDEIRVSTGIARSPDWIAAEFNNQSSPSKFYALSPESQFVSLAPAATSLYAAQTQQFAATVVANCNQGITWTISPTNVGSISATGLYTAPASIATQQPVTVTATSQANTSNSASATVTLYPPETITVTPATVPIYGGQTQQFAASFTNALSTATTWSVSPTGFGSISTTGLYTAPATITTQQTLTVTATSQQNSSLSATATITLFPPVTVGVSPTTSILYGGQTQQFTASVTDTINPTVTWSVSPSGVGSIASGGLYSAPASVSTVQPITVTATSVTDPTKFASVTLNLAPQNTVLVFPQTVTLAPSQTQQFIAEVANSNTAVTWTISPSGLGAISSTGLYTAPAANCDQQIITITATSVANPSESSSATVTLSNANGYGYQRPITINHTKIPNTDQTNFPVSINGTYPWLASSANGGHVVNPNGYDIVFTSDPFCVSKLNFEIEEWNGQTGQIVGWVQIPTLSHTSDTVIYACYGNPSISTAQSNTQGTWDATFEGVWHFPNGTTLTANDSTANGNNASFLAGTGAAAGKFDGAASFNGSSNYIDIPNSPSLDNWTTQTISIWANIQPGVNPGFARLVEKGPGNEWSIVWDGSDHILITAPDTEYISDSISLGDGQWHKVDLAIDPNLVSLYIDGALNVTQPAFVPAQANGNIRIGAFEGNFQNYYNGLADELRISNTERSPDWIAAAFASENSPSTFYSVGPETSETITVSPNQTALYAAQSQQFSAGMPAGCSTSITWTIVPASAGSISNAGLYTAPAAIAAPQSVTVTASQGSQSASAILTLYPPVSIGLTPAVSTVYGGGTQQFLAAVADAANPGVTWSISPAGTGSISAGGLYTAPANVSDPTTVTLTATSQADPTKSASATIQLVAGQGISSTTSSIGSVFNLIATALCARPHPAPVVDITTVPPFSTPGAPQYLALNCPSGPASCSTTTNVAGAAVSYTLAPGASLTYGWSVYDGPAPVQFSTPAQSSTNVTFTAAGTYQLQLSANDGVTTGSAIALVIVSPPADTGGALYITPTASGPNPVNTQIALQLKFVGFFYGVYNFNNATVNIQITGANPQTATVYTDVNGNATFNYTGKNPGVDTINAASTVCCTYTYVSNSVPVTWISPPPAITNSPVTGQFFSADGSGVFNTPATQQPLFTQTFPGIDFNPAGVTSSVSNLTRPLTDVLTNSSSAFAGVLPAQGNNYQAGVGTLYDFSAVFTGALSVPAAGPITFTFSSDDAFVFGVGNSATAVSGPQTNTPSSTAFTGLPVMGGVNQRSPVASNSITVNFPAPGVYPYEVDYAKGGDKNLTLTMLAGGAPIRPAALLTLSPAQTTPNQVDQVEVLNVSALAPDGVALGSLPVSVTVTGVNAQARSLTTDGTGQVQFAYEGIPIVGVDQIQATAVVNGVAVSSNVVTVPWNNGTNQAPVVSAGAAQTIMLPAQAFLSGVVTDDGLPNNTLTSTWSMLSGPGPVVFDDANQPATAATFNIPGTYVLQLSATDSVLTTNATVTITVNANTSNLTTGWIQSPVNNAAVSGQVPITLISGITLVSGTLTYFPATNPQAVVTLNASATGSGQVGTFDATLLANGGYFIILNGTNSQNVTQTSQVYVTSVGDYKPGRVTATITDLTVPAPGLPIQIQRTYDSLVRGTSSDFGYGWTLGVNIQTQVSPTGDVTLTINGKARTFYFTPPANGVFTYLYTPQYTPEPGLYGSLSNTGDNCSGVLLSVGNVWECAINNSGQIYQATGYQYTDAYGRIYTLAANGNLQSIQDLNNNTLTITPNGITSSSGLNVPFVRDSQGRITQITDTLRNQYQYAYDANGNLASVTYPSIATPAQYQYDPTHLLTQQIDQRGNIAGSSTYYPNGQLQSVTDAVGNTTQYAYNVAANTATVTNPDGGTGVTVADSYGDPLAVTDPLGRTTANTYDANHNLLTMTDPLGKTTTYTSGSNGFRTSLTDPLGNVSSAVYNPVGEPTSLTDPLSHAQNIAYDPNYNISSITDSIGQVAAFTYNGQAQPLTAIDARGNTTSYTYDQYGNKTSTTDPLQRTTNYSYDTQGNLSSQTDPRGNKTQYAYDAFNRKVSMTDAAGDITKYGYDGDNNLITQTDALNRVTSYAYDAANRQTQITYPDTTTRSSTYDFRGNKLTETDQLGRVTKYVYDLAGQLTSTTVAYGTSAAATTSLNYDLDGRELTQTDPRGNTTSYAYDAAGRQITLTDAVGNVTSYAYDAKSQRISMTDAKQRVTTYAYDARGRQLTTTTPDGKTVTKTYDGIGNVVTLTDENNLTTAYAYDAANQLTTVTDALSEVTQYGYDLSGNETRQTDANGHTTQYVFDSLNRRMSRTLPAGQTESFTYDAVSNKISHTDFNGRTTALAYDSLNRLLSRTPDPFFNAAPITFTYTSSGKRSSMTDPTGTTTYSYTNRDQVLTKATPQGTLAYTYDLFGNVASGLSSNANGTNVAYAWDADNRLSSVTDNRTSGVTNYTYDQTSQLSTMQYPIGVAHAFTYDSRDRPIGLNVTGPLGLRLTYTQNFDPSSHKLSVAEQSGRNTNYSYSSVYRLLTEAIASDPTASNNGALSYLLDPVGNRLSLASTLATLPNQTFTYDADDRLSSDTYDANGNTLTSGGNSFSYDFEDRLTQFDSSVQMGYDGDGNRIVRTQSGSTTRYLVDDLTPTGYPQVAEEVVNGAVIAQYTYGSWRISQNRSGALSYYGYDAGSSVRQLFSDTGAITDTYDYDAFGNTVVQTGSTVNAFLYRGEQFDPAIATYYLRARYYNPQTGRFLTTDRYEENSASGAWVRNIYDYAAGDPVSGLDPTGLDSFLEAGTLYQTDTRVFPAIIEAATEGYTEFGTSSFFNLYVAPFCKVLIALRAVSGQYSRGLGIPGWITTGATAACLALTPFY